MAYYSVHRTNPTQKNPLSIGSLTQIEQRRATRHHFVSAVEVINVESRKQLISLTRDLSLCGCFVTVKAPSLKGTRVSLKISNSKANFSAVGNVAHNLSDEGWESSLSRLRARIKRFSKSGWPRQARMPSDMNSNCQRT